MYTFKQYMKEAFEKDPKLKEAFEKEHLNYLMSQEIKEARKRKNMTQLELAKKVGMPQSVISRIESWNANIGMKTLSRILTWLGARIKIES